MITTLHRQLSVRTNPDGTLRFIVNKRACAGTYDGWIDLPRHDVERLRRLLNEMPTAKADADAYE